VGSCGVYIGRSLYGGGYIIASVGWVDGNMKKKREEGMCLVVHI
jgi:hypothetical protein